MPKKSTQKTLTSKGIDIDNLPRLPNQEVSNKNGRIIDMKHAGFSIRFHDKKTGKPKISPTWQIAGNRPDPKAAKLGELSKKEAQKIQRKRPDKDRIADAKKTSKKKSTDIRWAQNPNEYDYPGVDTKGKGAPRKAKKDK